MNELQNKIKSAPPDSIIQINEYFNRLGRSTDPISVDAAIAGIAKAVKLGKGDSEYSAEMKAFTGHLFGQDRSRVYAKKIVALKGVENTSPISAASSAIQTTYKLSEAITKSQVIKSNITDIGLKIGELQSNPQKKSAIKKADIMLAELLSYAKLKNGDPNFDATVAAKLTEIMDLLDIPQQQRTKM